MTQFPLCVLIKCPLQFQAMPGITPLSGDQILNSHFLMGDVICEGSHGKDSLSLG